MRKYKRLIATLVTLSMVLSVMPFLRRTVKADAATVVKFWGLVVDGDVSAESLTIADEAPDDEYVLAGMFIDGGTYELSEEERALGLFINNADVTATIYEDLEPDYYLSGNSSIIFPNITALTDSGNTPAYEGASDDIGQLMEFYFSDDYKGVWEEHDEGREWIKIPYYYSYTITGEFYGGLDARTITVEPDSEFIIMSFPWVDGEGQTQYGSNYVTVDNLIISGTVIIDDKEQAPYSNTIDVWQSITVNEGGQLVGFGDGNLFVSGEATVEGITLYERYVPETEEWIPKQFPNSENGSCYNCVEENGTKNWVVVDGGEGPVNNEIQLHFDNRFDDDGDPEVQPYAHAFVYVNSEGLEPEGRTAFVTGEPIAFKIVPPEEYSVSEAIVEIRRWNIETDSEELFSTNAEDSDHLIVVDANGEFTFTPDNDQALSVDIWWSEFDSLRPQGNQVQIDLNAWGDGIVEFSGGIDPVAQLDDTHREGRTRAIFDLSELAAEDGKIEILIAPSFGNKVLNVGIEETNCPYIEYYDHAENEDQLTFDDMEGLVDNGDGSYTYTLNTAETDEWGNGFIGFSAGFDNPVGVDGISVDPRCATGIFYSLDGGEYTELEIRHFEDEWNNSWDEYRLDPDEFREASTISFKFDIDEGYEVFGVRSEYFDGTYRCTNLPFDEGEGYVYTITRPESGWTNYRLTVLDYYVPYDNTYMLFLMGDSPEHMGLDVSAFYTPIPFEVGTPIEISVDADVYGVFARIADSREETELECVNGVYSYTPSGDHGVEIKIYATEAEYIFENTHARAGESELNFCIDYMDSPEDADRGSVTFLENEHIVATASNGRDYRVIVDYDPNSEDFESAVIGIKFDVPENAEFSIFMGEQDITQSVIDNDYVFEWDITGMLIGEDNTVPRIGIRLIETPEIRLFDTEGITVEYNTDGGDDYTVADGSSIALDDADEFVYVRFTADDPDAEVYGVHVRFGDNNFRERLENGQVYRFERGDHWITYEVSPVTEDDIFDMEYVVRFADDADSNSVTVVNDEIMDGLQRFGRFDEITIEAEGEIYCIEAQLNGETYHIFERDGNVYTYTAMDLNGFVATIYTSEEQYNFFHLWPDYSISEQYYVEYYCENESEETGSIAVEGEVARASYSGITKVIFNADNADEPKAVFTITPAEDYYYVATQDGEPFDGTYEIGSGDVFPEIVFNSRISIASAEITLTPSGDQDYTGEEIKPQVTVVLDGETLTEDVDYEVVYVNNVEPGEPKIRVDGIGMYCGYCSTSFKIVKDIAAVDLPSVAAQAYTGSAITPTITITDGTVTLEPDVDYTIEYSNNTGCGTAIITITGNGFYYGTATITFAITGWSKSGDVWTYYGPDGSIIMSDWTKVNGTWYYFNESGAMVTGWQKIGNTWYYFNGSGAMVTGWQKIGNTWYYFNASGAMATGWQSIGETWYYFNTSGAMATGWQKIGNTWYYFKSSGAMVTGWQSIGNTWYYFKSSGAMATGWQKIGNTWYYFKSSGAMQTGWLNNGGTWYYFKSSGAMVTGWQKIGNSWYYFYGSGAMAVNATIGNYRVGADGKMI